MPPQHAFYVTQIPDLDKKKEGTKQAISGVVLFTYYKAFFAILVGKKSSL